MKNMTVVALTNGLHDEFASLGQSAEEHKGLGRREGGKVGTGLTQHLTRKSIHIQRNLVTLIGGKRYIERGDVLRLQAAKQGRCVGLGKHFASCARHTRSRAISLQASLPATATRTSVLTAHDNMAQFTGKAVAAIDQLSIDHNTRTDTRAQREHDEVFHAPCHTIGHLSHSRSIGVVRDG